MRKLAYSVKRSAFSLIALVFIFVFLLYAVPLMLNTTYAVTREEQAVYNISNGNLPPEIVNEPIENEDGIKSFLDKAGEFVSSFFNAPKDKPKYYAQSERVNKGDVPDQVVPKSTSFFDSLLSFVGKNTGFYSNYLPPEFVKDDKVLGVNLTTNPATLIKPREIKDYEEAFETTHFPDGISPVTGSRTKSSTPTNTSPTSSTPSTPGQFNTALEEQMIKMVNEERAKAGVRPLTFDPTLLPLARDIAKDIPNLVDKPELFYAHINSRGEDLAKRAERLGITYRPIYENLSHSHQDVNKSMQGLLSSKGHKDNMLQPELTKIAIGVYQGENVVYVAQVFR